MRKKFLFIGATHGDESIGVTVLSKIHQTDPRMDWIVGNPRAFEKGVRYTDCDLNRSAPGDTLSREYEQRRAADIIALANTYQYTIDIHGVKNDCGIFLIVTNPNKETLRLASYFDIKQLVIWPSITPEMKSPLSEYMRCGIEIECGKKDAPQTALRLSSSLQSFFQQVDQYEREDDTAMYDRLARKSCYEFYGTLSKDEQQPNPQTLNEFQAITIRNETFHPVFINTYDEYTDMLCYK